QGGEVGLSYRRIDVGVQVVVEHPEQPVEPDVDAGRLQQLRLERVEPQLAGLDSDRQVPVGEEHVWQCLTSSFFAPDQRLVRRPARSSATMRRPALMIGSTSRNLLGWRGANRSEERRVGKEGG